MGDMDDNFPPLDLPGEMTDEDWAALSELGGGYGGLDTPPPLEVSRTAFDLMGTDPMGWLAPSVAPFDVAGNYYDDSYYEMPWETGSVRDTVAPSLDSVLSSVGSTGVGSDRTSGVQPGSSKMDPYSQKYSDDSLSFLLAAGRFDPESGQWKPGDQYKAPSMWDKVSSFLGLKEEVDPKTGRPVQRSPSSSLAGMAAGAASGAAASRTAEAKLALDRDQTRASVYGTQQNAQLRSAEIEMMRKRLLNAQRSAALHMLQSPTATAAQKAAAQQTLATLDQQLTTPTMVPKPGEVAMPTRSWWETALATAGLAGMGAQAAQTAPRTR